MKPRTNRAAFSLIEIMVSITLLSLIVIGLLAVFNHTQRALRVAHSQTDVFEGARAVVDLVTRDLSEITPTGDTNTYNIYAADLPPITLPKPGGGLQTNVVQDIFTISRQNDMFIATGYFLDRNAIGVGTLYRFTTNGFWHGRNYSFDYLTNWWSSFTNAAITNANRVADGIIHFQTRAFDARGRLYMEPFPLPYGTNDVITNNITAWVDGYGFKGDFLPAYVEVEIGILEPQATRQFNALAAVDANAAKTFLQNQLGKVHLFRQRIPVRNHLQPEPFY